MKMSTFLLIFSVICLQSKTINAFEVFPFPKVLWTYWSSGQQNLQLFTRLCLNNMRHYANISNWEFKFLTDQTMYDYISSQGQQSMKKMLANENYPFGPAGKADVLRLHLLYENGGMWLDLNTVFVRDFSWIDKMESQIDITNKIGTSPEFIGFTTRSASNNLTIVIDKKLDVHIELDPGVQMWFILAKKGGLFLQDLLKNLQYTLGQKKQYLQKENTRMGVIHGQINDYYIAANYNLQTVLQRKQREIDASPSTYTTKYAVEYYKLWTIDAFKSGFILAPNNIELYSQMHQSLEAIIKQHNQKLVLAKFSNYQYHIISRNIEKIAQSLCGTNQRFFEENSVLNQFFLKPSMHLEEVRLISTLNFQGRVQVNAQLCTEGQQIRSLVSNLYQLVFFLLCGALFLCIFVYQANWMPEEKEEAYDKLKSLPQSDEQL